MRHRQVWRRAARLDIDGVFIRFPGLDGQRAARPHSPEVVPTDAPVPIWLTARLGALVADLLAAEDVEGVWASSWQADADTLIGPRLGIPPIGHIPLGRPNITTSHPRGYLWKRDPVSAWLANRPAAWIDDDFTRLDHAWAARRNTAGIPTLLIQPDPHVGLRPDHVSQVREWASTRPTMLEGLFRSSSDHWRPPRLRT